MEANNNCDQPMIAPPPPPPHQPQNFDIINCHQSCNESTTASPPPPPPANLDLIAFIDTDDSNNDLPWLDDLLMDDKKDDREWDLDDLLTENHKNDMECDPSWMDELLQSLSYDG